MVLVVKEWGGHLIWKPLCQLLPLQVSPLATYSCHPFLCTPSRWCPSSWRPPELDFVFQGLGTDCAGEEVVQAKFTNERYGVQLPLEGEGKLKDGFTCSQIPGNWFATISTTDLLQSVSTPGNWFATSIGSFAEHAPCRSHPKAQVHLLLTGSFPAFLPEAEWGGAKSSSLKPRLQTHPSHTPIPAGLPESKLALSTAGHLKGDGH